MSMQIDWLGGKVIDLVLDASAKAVDQSGKDAVNAAKSNAPVDRGNLRDDIQVVEKGIKDDTVYVGWGAPNSPYALAVEVLHPRKRGFLRKSQDSVTGKLGKLIKDYVNAAAR